MTTERLRAGMIVKVATEGRLRLRRPDGPDRWWADLRDDDGNFVDPKDSDQTLIYIDEIIEVEPCNP